MNWLRTNITRTMNHLHRLLTRPTEELSRVQRSVRYMYELASHCISELGHDQALQMAAALTYRTIFSLIPLFVLALVAFRLTGGLDDKRQQVQQELYNYLGLNFTTNLPPSAVLSPDDPRAFAPDSSIESIEAEVQVQADAQSLETLDALESREVNDAQTVAGTAGLPATTQPVGDANSNTKNTPTANVLGATSEAQKTETRASLDKIIQSLTDKVSNTSASGITVVGLLVLIWAAVSLVVTVEQSLNQVYGTPTGRPWHLKILIYWGIITLGPVLLAVSLYVAGLLMEWANTLGPVGWLAQQLSRFTALAASWLLLFLLYVLMPNTRVHLKPAAIGAFVAACLWELGKWGFKLYAANAGFSTLYGSLAMIPLFLYWVYITWTIVLFGAELSYALQAMKGKKFKHDEHRADRQMFVDPRWVLPVMIAMGSDFDLGKTSSPDDLAQRLSLPHRAVTLLTQKLESLGLIHQVECHDESLCAYALARSPDKLPVRELLQAGDKLTAGNNAQHGQNGEWKYVHQLTQAGHDMAGDTTLMDLIRETNETKNVTNTPTNK